jgi:hypothetical protein
VTPHRPANAAAVNGRDAASVRVCRWWEVALRGSRHRPETDSGGWEPRHRQRRARQPAARGVTPWTNSTLPAKRDCTLTPGFCCLNTSITLVNGQPSARPMNDQGARHRRRVAEPAAAAPLARDPPDPHPARTTATQRGALPIGAPFSSRTMSIRCESPLWGTAADRRLRPGCASTTTRSEWD